MTIDYNKNCILQFGTYVQVHEPYDDTLMPRASGAITLQPSGNSQGSYYFLSLHSGKSVIKNKWMVLPMLTEVMATVQQLADTCKKYKGIVFKDKDGNLLDDTNDEEGEEEDNTLLIKGVDGEVTGVTEVDDKSTGVHNVSGLTKVDYEITGVHNERNQYTPQYTTQTHEKPLEKIKQ